MPYINALSESAASVNATSVVASRTYLNGVRVTNTTGGAVFLKLYDKATAPTVGTDVPKMLVRVPANDTVHVEFRWPILFELGIGYGTTTGAADTDTTAPTAGAFVGLIISHGDYER